MVQGLCGMKAHRLRQFCVSAASKDIETHPAGATKA
jgi:hypothetical protein